jgi:hypothetical protein
MSTRKSSGIAAAVVVGVGAIGAIATIPKAAKATAAVDGLSDLRSIDRSEALARMSGHSPGGAPNSLDDAHHQAMAEDPDRRDLGAVVDVIDSSLLVVDFADKCGQGLGVCMDQEPKALLDADLQKRLGSVQRGQATMELLRKQGAEVAANYARERELASRPGQPIKGYTAEDAATKRAQLNLIIEHGLSSGDDWDAIGRAIQDAFPKADVPRLVEAARRKHAEIGERTRPPPVELDLGIAAPSTAIPNGHR